MKSWVGEAYRRACEIPSDINQHLPTLRGLAESLAQRRPDPRIVELGVRKGTSTLAWLAAVEATGGHVWCVDVDPIPRRLALHAQVTPVQGDDLSAEVLQQIPDQVDIVFVDSSHEYAHTVLEIEAYAGRLRSEGCMVFHDSAELRFAHHRRRQPNYPVAAAVQRWLDTSTADLQALRYENNHGLTVVQVP